MRLDLAVLPVNAAATRVLQMEFVAYDQRSWWSSMLGMHVWRDLSNVQRWALGAIVVVALGVRIFGIAAESLWIDEAASWGFSRLPLSELWGAVPKYEPHPPLYYTLLKLWSMLAGTSETGLRLLSAIPGVVTVYIVFVAGRLVLGDGKGIWIALCGTAIFALHPVQIHFSQEARAYALQSLGVAMSFLAVCWWLRNPAALAVTPGKLFAGTTAGSRQALALFVGGATFAIWLHYTGILLVGTFLGLGAIVNIAASPQRGRTAVNLVLLGLIILTLWAPCGYLALAALGPLSESGHVHTPGIYRLGFSFDYLFGPGLTTLMPTTSSEYVAAGFMGLFAVAGAAALVKRGQMLVAALLSLAAGLPILMAIAASYAGFPAFGERSMIWIQIPYALLIASSMLWISVRSLQFAGLAALVAWFAIASPIERSRLHKEPWRQIVALLEKEAGPDGLVMTWYDYAQVPLQYYHAAERIRAPRLRLWKSGDEYPTMSAAISPLDRLSTDEVLARVSQSLDVKGTIWVLTFSATTSPVVRGMHQQLAALRGPPILRVDFSLPGADVPPVQLSEYRAGGTK